MIHEALSPCIKKLLEKDQDGMIDELPRHLLPRHEVDHKFEWELGAKPSH